MLRNVFILFASLSLILSLTACISEKDKEDMRKMLKDSNSKSSSSELISVSSNSSGLPDTSISSNSESKNSASTQIDNKPPKTEKNKDGITIHITKSELDEISQALKEASKQIQDIEIPEYDSNYDLEYSHREYSTSDSWREKLETKDSNGKYPWEYDENIPEFDFEISVPPFTGQGKGDTGANGSSIKFPDSSEYSTK